MHGFANAIVALNSTHGPRALRHAHTVVVGHVNANKPSIELGGFTPDR